MLRHTIVIGALIAFVLTLVFALVVGAPVALMFINQ